jgi:hypothetical protein
MKTAIPLGSDLATDQGLSSLLTLALRGLSVMRNPNDETFCHRIVKHPDGLRRDGSSLRYSLITLLGLTAAERIGLTSEFDTEGMLQHFLSGLAGLDDLGDLALLLWLCAEREPDRLQPVLHSPSLRGRIESLDAFRQARTMELSWLLAALSHIQMADPAAVNGNSDLAHTVFRLLLRNQGPQGLFGHHGPGSSLAASLRSRLGSFADQIYPIYALAQYSQAWQAKGALASATKCADTLCALQGPLGQWWWHYDSLRGRAVSHYPVYSVHQDGMAPMALFALGRLSATRYDRPAYKGLAWIYGENELGADMRDPDTGLIWRSLYPHPFIRYSSEVLSMLGGTLRETTLRVLYECRPYHLGWLLYAFCPQIHQKLSDPDRISTQEKLRT